jgi:ADA HAT complex component 1
MQSMFRLPWSTESPGDKIMEKATLHKQRQMPVVDMPHFMNHIKRKRTDSPEPASSQHAHVVKKWKSAQGDVKPVLVPRSSSPSVPTKVAPEMSRPQDQQDLPLMAPAEILDARPKAQPTRKDSTCKSKVSSKSPKIAPSQEPAATPVASMESNLTAAQQAIEAQISYEILLKHNELRLIEQELAKCQVSLEQLRRCSLIPFPGTEGLSDDVSRGVGAALQPPTGYTEPHFAAPWGVTDGPYTRHYAKWLISDMQFDPMSERALAQQAQGYFGNGEGRTTRGSFTDCGSVNKGRTSRTSTGMLKLAPLGENPAPAPKIDPLLHKRSTDGQWVRLYCAQCGHSNFSNTQGFLNHCRIKHSLVFKSHDQAAIACGVPVDINESGNPVTATEPVSTPASTPAVTFLGPITPGIVHPLAAQPAPPKQAKDVHRDFNKLPCDAPKPSTPANLTTSPSTPSLSALLQKRGFEGDLKALVNTARSPIDLDVLEHSDDDLADTTAAPTPITTNPPQLARLPISAPNNTTSARPGSKKSNVHARLLSFPSPIKSECDDHIPASPLDLSPHTVESNPGLVSDHDDDDDDEDDTHSQPDFMITDNVVVEDASDVEGSRHSLNGCFEKGEASRKH